MISLHHALNLLAFIFSVCCLYALNFSLQPMSGNFSNPPLSLAHFTHSLDHINDHAMTSNVPLLRGTLMVGLFDVVNAATDVGATAGDGPRRVVDEPIVAT